MKLFNVKCKSCGHSWTDISKSYVCPNCWSVKTELIYRGIKNNINIVTIGLAISFLAFAAANTILFLAVN